MAIEGKYGKVDVPGIPDDEPIFILRAQDSLADKAMWSYMFLCTAAGSPDHHIQGIDAAIQTFYSWRDRGGQFKMPTSDSLEPKGRPIRDNPQA